MKTTITLLAFLLFFVGVSNAQMIKSPIDDKTSTEAIPEAPEGEFSWVKAHWNWTGYEYEWVEGEYIETKDSHVWVDGEWERDKSTGAWFYSNGYWNTAEQSATIDGVQDIEQDVAANTAITFGAFFK